MCVCVCVCVCVCACVCVFVCVARCVFYVVDHMWCDEVFLVVSGRGVDDSQASCYVKHTLQELLPLQPW